MKAQIAQELLPGCFVISTPRLRDDRGWFLKTYSRPAFEALGIAFSAAEEFISSSRLGVVRGMHFQLPPHAHAKVVTCLQGRVRDVLLDLRRGSNYGNFAVYELSAESAELIYIPVGVAHGFMSLEEGSTMLYQTSTPHAPEADAGILWSGFGFDWGISAPILSQRDGCHPSLETFETPF